MLNLAEFPTLPNFYPIVRIPNSQAFIFPLQPNFSFSSYKTTRLGFCPLRWKSRSGFCSYASKSEGKGGNSVVEMEDFDGFEEFEEYEDDDDGDDDDEVFVPLKDMKDWIENRPRGFGEGKEYDTSIDDKLMEEIEQSRRAQLVNIIKLKNSPVNETAEDSQIPKGEVSKDVHEGFRVRLVSLPKKKNIHKDLQLAFKGFPGIVNIVPVVSGNKKTKDPICKGIAFIDFKSEDAAQRFVQTFSGQSIYFGKVQKRIKCEVMKSSSTKSKNAQSVDETRYDAELSELDSDGELEDDFEIYSHTLDSWEENDSPQYDYAMEHDYDKIVETSLETNSSDEEDNATQEPATNLSSSTIQSKTEVNEKKKAKRKKDKPSKLNIPGSARRLKIKEKALLTGVLSKYGLNAAEVKKEQS